MNPSNLDLESARAATTASAFEFASLRSYVGLDRGMSVGVADRSAVAKVRKGLAGLRSTQKNCVRTLRGTKRQLVERDALPP